MQSTPCFFLLKMKMPMERFYKFISFLNPRVYFLCTSVQPWEISSDLPEIFFSFIFNETTTLKYTQNHLLTVNIGCMRAKKNALYFMFARRQFCQCTLASKD